MSGQIINFEGRTHREVERLLPWFVNGTLEPDERVWLERHIDECGQCQREIAELNELQAAYMQQAEQESVTDPTRAWQRMRGRLSAPGHAQTQRSWWSRALQDWRQAAPWLRYALAAQPLLLAIGAFISMPRDEPAPYRTLSTQAAAHDATNTLVIVFDPQTTEAQMRRMLRASHAQIVEGPNDAGAYVLAVPAHRLATVREALRSAPGVTLVESLAPEDAH